MGALIRALQVVVIGAVMIGILFIIYFGLKYLIILLWNVIKKETLPIRNWIVNKIKNSK